MDETTLRILFEGAGADGGPPAASGAGSPSVGNSAEPDILKAFREAIKEQTEAIANAVRQAGAGGGGGGGGQSVNINTGGRQGGPSQLASQGAKGGSGGGTQGGGRGAAGGAKGGGGAAAVVQTVVNELMKLSDFIRTWYSQETKLMEARNIAAARAVGGADPVAIRNERRRAEIEVTRDRLSGIPLLGGEISKWYEASQKRGMLGDEQFVRVSGGLRQRANELSMFGGSLAGATSRRDIAQLSRDAAESQVLGARLSALTDAETEYNLRKQQVQAIERDKAAQKTREQYLKEAAAMKKQLDELVRKGDRNAERIIKALERGGRSPLDKFLGGIKMPDDPNAAAEEQNKLRDDAPINGPIFALGEAK